MLLRLFVPCTVVGGVRRVMALPAVEPVLHVISFATAAEALAAHGARTFVCEDMEVSQPFGGRDNLSGECWETTPEELALCGMAGPSGFGIALCELLDGGVILGRESAVVTVEEVDYESVRDRLETDYARATADESWLAVLCAFLLAAASWPDVGKSEPS